MQDLVNKILRSLWSPGLWYWMKDFYSKHFANRADLERSMTDTERRPRIERPDTISQLNDSVYKLYSPEGPPEIDVIFFHGLQRSNYQEAVWKTWLSRDGTEVWPQNWLGNRFPKSRVLSISYDSEAVRGDSSGQTDPYIISENLIYDIIRNPNCGAGKDRPIVLVGHCLGGIIIKMLVLDCLKRKGQGMDVAGSLEAFLENLKGVFFYAPPQKGADVEGYLGKQAEPNEGILALLRVLGKETARINDDFNKAKHLLHIPMGGIMEGLATEVEKVEELEGGKKVRIVPEALARGVGMDVLYTATKADHIDVCRPKDKDDNIFKALVHFIEWIVPDLSKTDTYTSHLLT